MRTTGNPLNLERLSGRLFFTPEDETGFIDLGDVLMHKATPETASVSGMFHTRAAAEREVRRDNKSVTKRWEVKLQEHTVFNEAILLQGVVGADHVQNAVSVAATADINDIVLDRWYDIGKLDLNTVSATVATVAKIIGTIGDDGTVTPADADIALDAKLGMIKPLSTGTCAAGDDIVVTYKAAAVTMATVEEVGQHNLRRGSFKLVSFDGESSPARSILTFNGQLNPKDWGENSTDKLNDFTFEVIATGDVSVFLGDEPES